MRWTVPQRALRKGTGRFNREPLTLATAETTLMYKLADLARTKPLCEKLYAPRNAALNNSRSFRRQRLFANAAVG